MSFLRTAPWGAVCVWMAASAIASPLPAPVATAALQNAVRDVWAASPDVQAADAERQAARARARAAAQPVYNPSLSIEGENADVDRRTVGASLTLDVSGKRAARLSEGEALLVPASDAAGAAPAVMGSFALLNGSAARTARPALSLISASFPSRTVATAAPAVARQPASSPSRSWPLRLVGIGGRGS